MTHGPSAEEPAVSVVPPPAGLDRVGGSDRSLSDAPALDDLEEQAYIDACWREYRAAITGDVIAYVVAGMDLEWKLKSQPDSKQLKAQLQQLNERRVSEPYHFLNGGIGPLRHEVTAFWKSKMRSLQRNAIILKTLC